MELQFISSEKCKTLLVVNSYKFNRNHVSKNNTITLCCTNKMCKAKINTKGETLDITNLEKVNLTYDLDINLKGQQVNNACKRKAENHPHGKPSELIRKELASFD